MAVNNVVEYTDAGLKIFKPDDGEKHIVYVRPGDEVKLEFNDEVQYRLVDGDVLAILPNGSQLVFLALGTMAMTPDPGMAPKIIDGFGKEINILSVAEITELTDQEKPIASRFLEFQPSSEEPAEVEERLSRQEERLENTLEAVNEYVSELAENTIAGPQASTDAKGDQNSGTQTTVEFVQETVEQVLKATEDTTVPEPVQPSSQTLTAVPQPDTKVNTEAQPIVEPSVFEVKGINIYGVSGGLKTANEYQGGTSSAESVTSSNPNYRVAPEVINVANISNGVTVYADNNYLMQSSSGKAEFMTQVVSIDVSDISNYFVSDIVIAGLPEGVRVYASTVDAYTINGSTAVLNTGGTSVTLNEGSEFTRNQEIKFTIRYPVDTADFKITVTANAKFDVTSGAVTPTETTKTATADFDILVKPVEQASDIGESNVLAEYPTGNLITTGAGSDTIFGGVGIDNINAGEGDDVISPGAGNDVISGGQGSDSISYINQEGKIIVTMEDGEVAGSVKNVTSDTNEEIEKDTIYSIENIEGTQGNDELSGNSSDNTLKGSGGDDTISGGLGDDTLIGGAGNDTLKYHYEKSDSAGYNINLNSETASLIGGTEVDSIVGFENVVGSDFNDVITGTDEKNHIDGGDGNDTISGGADGTDTLIGGANDAFQITLDTATQTFNVNGGDTVDFSGRTNGISSMDLAATTSVVTHNGGSNYGTIAEFENVKGSSQTDTISSIGVADNIFYATEGSDVLNAGANNTVDIEINGSSISITGGDTYDLSGITSQNDLVESTEIDLEAQSSVIKVQSGQITQTINDFEHAIGTSLNDIITGTSGDNYLSGGAGDDTIYGGSGGQDIINGGDGVDQASFQKLVNASGITVDYDIVNNRYSAEDNSQSGESNPSLLINIEKIEGTNNNDQFTGSTNQDTFIGLEGDDIFRATRGEDTYIGGDGSDLLTYAIKNADPNIEDNRFINEDGRLADIATTLSVDSALKYAYGSSSSQGEITNLANEISYQSSVDLTGLRIDMQQTQVDSEGTYFQATYAENTIGGSVFKNDKIYGVENIVGTSANDYLAGNDLVNSLDGGLGNDFIAGRGGNDTLSGGEGNDILIGGLGNDVIDGGTGQDWVSYQFATSDITVDLSTKTSQNTVSEGQDTITNVENIISGEGNDTLTGDSSVNHIIAGKGDDILNGLGGSDILEGGEGMDTVDFSHVIYNGGVSLALADNSASTASYKNRLIDTNVQLTSIESIIGSGGDDNISGNSEDNHITGGEGNDTITGGISGNDTLIGGAGNDSISYTNRNGSIDGGTGDDTLDLTVANSSYTLNLSSSNQMDSGLTQTTISGFETIIAGGGNQVIHASSTVKNDLTMGDGADTVFGGSGGDLYDGGEGNDIITYEETGQAITADFSENSNITNSSSGTLHSTITGFETIKGSVFDDTIVLGDQQSNLVNIETLAGNDRVGIDSSMADENITVDGGTGEDTLTFDAFANAITVLTDKVTMMSDSNSPTGEVNFSNIETIQGGASSQDKIEVSRAIEVDGNIITIDGLGREYQDIEILDNSGNSAASTYENLGNSDFRQVSAGSNNDEFYLSSNSNNGSTITLNAGAGDDLLDSTGFTDSSNVSEITNNIFTASDGNTYELNNFETIVGGAEQDNWDFSNFGNTGDLNINSGASNDTITGSEHADIIHGGAGDDILIGGTGNNTLIGGAGSDTFTITGEEVVTYADESENFSGGGININYNDNSDSIQVTDGSGSSDLIEVDSNDNLTIIGTESDDTLQLTLGTSTNLGAFNAGSQGNSQSDTQGDVVEISGTLTSSGNDTIHDQLPTLTGIEELNFEGLTTLDETLTFSTSELYNLAGENTEITGDGGHSYSGREIRLTFDDADIADWSNIQFSLDGSSNTTAAQISGFSDNTITLDNITEGTIGSVDETLGVGEHHIYFNDASGTGEDLHVVINVV